MDHPLLLAPLAAAGLFVAKLWHGDLQARRRGAGNPNALPGASPARPAAILIAVAGALLLLAAETRGEVALGVAAEQARITWLFAAYSVAGAPVLEELIFRGWLVVENRGRVALWASAVAASVAFAALHPFLWRWDDAGFAFHLGRKGVFSTAFVFLTSLWLYAARFGRWNPGHSLLPCFAAHAAKNLGVVLVKAATGFMGALW